MFQQLTIVGHAGADTVRFLGKREAHQPVATGSAPAADVQPAGLELVSAAEVAF